MKEFEVDVDHHRGHPDMANLASNVERGHPDPALVAEILSKPPFVKIEGVSNVRTLGSYQVPSKNGSSPQLITRPNFLFRSAEISGITEKGKSQLRDLNIRKIFDLRSKTEMDKYNAPVPEIEDVDVRWTPVFKTQDYSDTTMTERYKKYSSDKVEAFMELYSEILKSGGSAYGEILRHVRDEPQDGCLFHCTAGKDRTAVIAAILLLLAGIDDEAIARDYELTTYGRQPDRDRTIERLKKHAFFAENPDRALNMLSARYETMLAFLDLLRQKYGGAEGYVKDYCKMTDDDMEIIRRNLLTNSSRL